MVEEKDIQLEGRVAFAKLDVNGYNEVMTEIRKLLERHGGKVEWKTVTVFREEFQ